MHLRLAACWLTTQPSHRVFPVRRPTVVIPVSIVHIQLTHPSIIYTPSFAVCRSHRRPSIRPHLPSNRRSRPSSLTEQRGGHPPNRTPVTTKCHHGHHDHQPVLDSHHTSPYICYSSRGDIQVHDPAAATATTTPHPRPDPPTSPPSITVVTTTAAPLPNSVATHAHPYRSTSARRRCRRHPSSPRTNTYTVVESALRLGYRSQPFLSFATARPSHRERKNSESLSETLFYTTHTHCAQSGREPVFEEGKISLTATVSYEAPSYSTTTPIPLN